ncbi:hypothetical protein P9443_13290 [Peribacillus frigoritolerans]|uniref:hypothetical protein n=1 Tax=Peribacillus frigoritolerans TaxID=450367 RepID=UPI002E1D38EF|nr:hypothetical protein [Peribacillus frigoritolerans]
MSMLSIHDSIQRDQLEMITLDQLGTLKKTHEAQLLPGKLQLNPYLLLAVDPSLSQDLKGKELLPSYMKFLDAQFHFFRS